MAAEGRTGLEIRRGRCRTIVLYKVSMPKSAERWGNARGPISKCAIKVEVESVPSFRLLHRSAQRMSIPAPARRSPPPMGPGATQTKALTLPPISSFSRPELQRPTSANALPPLSYAGHRPMYSSDPAQATLAKNQYNSSSVLANARYSPTAARPYSIPSHLVHPAPAPRPAEVSGPIPPQNGVPSNYAGCSQCGTYDPNVWRSDARGPSQCSYCCHSLFPKEQRFLC